MIHTIRQHGQLTQIDCELGSGMLDKNGREIIEGDKVKYTNVIGTKSTIGVVEIFCASFYLLGVQLASYLKSELEVVGHVTEVEK